MIDSKCADMGRQAHHGCRVNAVECFTIPYTYMTFPEVVREIDNSVSRFRPVYTRLGQPIYGKNTDSMRSLYARVVFDAEMQIGRAHV